MSICPLQSEAILFCLCLVRVATNTTQPTPGHLPIGDVGSKALGGIAERRR